MRSGTLRVRGVVVAASLAGLLCPVAALGTEPAGSSGRGVVLHRPGYESHFAFVDQRAAIHRRPSRASPKIGRLRLRTGDRTDELVPALEAVRNHRGRRWVRIRFASRRSERTGWVRRWALGELRTVNTWLRVDRSRLRATLVRNGRVVFRARVGIGKSYWPTPRGNFYIRSRMSDYGAGSIYGPVAFGTSAMSPVLTDWPGGGFIGIHGTNEPWLVPGRVSHGCIRLRNREIRRLARLMPVGTPLTIR